MPKQLEIAQIGDPILRDVARGVGNVLDAEIKELVANMIYTSKQAGGVGISAPQVRRSIRLFIISSEPNPRYPDAPRVNPIAIFNPRNFLGSTERIDGWEGCLSVPGIMGIVPRHKWINVTYTNQDGQEVVTTFEGLLARVFQHELDHIDGITFLERADPRSLSTREELLKNLKSQAKSS